MGLAAVGFIGYAAIFFVLNFTRLLEIGIGPEQVDVGKAEIEAFSPSLYQYVSHLQVALSGAIAAIGVAVCSWLGTAFAAGPCGPGSVL